MGIVGVLLGVTMATLAAPSAAQTIDCGEYEGLVCEGVFTDEPDLVPDPDRVAEAIARVTTAHGNPFAVVIASDARGREPVTFAADLANAWGVGDPVDEDGILVLVAIAERRTEVVTQAGIELPGTAIANAGRSFFAAGDFEGGVLAIIGAVDQALSGDLAPPTGDTATSFPLGAFGAIIAIGGVALGTGALVSRRRRRRSVVRASRDRRIDALVAELEPRGDEVPTVERFRIAPPHGDAATSTTEAALRALFAIAGSNSPANQADRDLSSLAEVGAISVIDVDALTEATRVPIDLRMNGERPILEAGLESSISAAAAVPVDDDAAFDLAIMELEGVVRSLRPHRIAAARRRAADALIASLVSTPIGPVAIEHLGTLIMRAAPVLDGSLPLRTSADDVASAHLIAEAKVDRLATIRDRLEDSSTRDVAAVALADLSGDVEGSIAAYQTTLDALEREGGALDDDGLSLPAVAALLVMNNSVDDIGRFVDAYEALRAGNPPVVALEAAAAGLFTQAQLDEAEMTAEDLGLPIAVAVALSRRRDDGATVYRRLLDDVIDVAEGPDAQVIAGILAISLEPTLAIDRWRETRVALAALGLSGAYADVASAFGASDPRGPRAFALAYAAQRSAMEDAGLSDLTRYAPELAHAGTSDQRDSWTGRPLGRSPADFDPFTFFYLHWAAAGGHHGDRGWSTLYASPSWRDGGSTWWGGGTGFGSSGGSSWDSNWGSGSGGFGGFGGFGGGGGFSGGGGGSW